MVEKGCGGDPGSRAARRTSAAAGLHPALLEEDIERALADSDAADLLDLGPGCRLVVGDDRQGFKRCAGQAPLHLLLPPEHRPKIRRSAQGPTVADLHQIDAALGIVLGQGRETRLDIGTFGQMRRQVVLTERRSAGEQQRLYYPNLLGFHRVAVGAQGLVSLLRI